MKRCRRCVDDVMQFMTSQHGNRNVTYTLCRFDNCFYSQLEMLICFSIKLSRIKMLSNRKQCSVTS